MLQSTTSTLNCHTECCKMATVSHSRVMYKHFRGRYVGQDQSQIPCSLIRPTSPFWPLTRHNSWQHWPNQRMIAGICPQTSSSLTGDIMTQTMASPDPPTDSAFQYHGKVIRVQSMYIESYHIDNNRPIFCMIHLRCCDKFNIEYKKPSVIQFIKLWIKSRHRNVINKWHAKMCYHCEIQQWTQ